MPSYMAPIGHNKNQKHTASQFKEYYNSINLNGTNQSKKSNPHYYINTNGNDKKKTIELPPLNSPKQKNNKASYDKFNVSHYKNKKPMVLKINL